jgi:hypothetical protein
VAGYKETFGANVDYAYGRGVNDLGNRLQSGMARLSGAGKELGAFMSQAQNARRGIKDLGNEMKSLRNDISAATDPKEVRRLTREFENARKTAEKFRKQLIQVPFQAMEQGLKKIVSGLLSFNTSILSMSFNFLIDSIKRVYELQERWTKAIGGFNMKLGGMTKGLQGAQKAAVQWSSTIRGLTNGDINEGIQMFGEFTMAIGRTVKAGDGFSKLGLQMARGFGLGGQGAGQILKVFENIGMSADDSAEAMKTTVKAANQAGIPVNMLADDLEKSITYMARFGKEGQKTLIQGAAWARKYDIALEQLKNSVEGFDMFDDAAKSASKLNTAFGTMINSMDLMMEDDPAARLDMIRQSMLAQGMTYDKLTPKQRRYFSETMKLSEEQTAALLDSKNAGESYQDFAAKAEAKQKQELKAKEMMQKMLQKTAQTMYAFGAAFDRVTIAIGKAIRPLLEVLGLAKKSDKDFKGFGQVMEGITKTVIHFFESLAGNDKWMGFMRELGKDLQRAGSALKEFVMSGRAADMVGDIAKGMKNFYVTVRDLAIRAAPAFKPLLEILFKLSEHIKGLALAWAGMKAFNMIGGPGKLVSMLGSIGGMGKLGKAGLGAGIGGLAGGLMGGTGAGVGGAVGGALGSLGGPIGMVIGPLLGAAIGKGVEWMLKSPTVKTQLQVAQEDLVKTIKREQATRAGYEAQVASFEARQTAEDTLRKSRAEVLKGIDRQMITTKSKEVFLNKEQAKMLSEHSSELALFTRSTKVSKDMLMSLGEGSRLTKDQLKALMKGSADYETALGKLRDTSEQVLKQQQAQLEVSQLGVQKTSLEMIGKNLAAELASDKAKQATVGKFGKTAFEGDTRGPAGLIEDMIDLQARSGKDFQKYRDKLSAKEQTQLDLAMKIRKAELENTANEKKLQQLQTDFIKQQSIIQLRALEMSSGRFLEFQKTSGIKDIGAAFEAYLKQNETSLSGLYGESGYKLLSEKPTFMARGGVVTRPTKAVIGEAGPEAVIPLSRTNFAGGGGDSLGVGGGTTVVQLNVDGQKLARAVVKNAIRGRN